MKYREVCLVSGIFLAAFVFALIAIRGYVTVLNGVALFVDGYLIGRGLGK